MTPEQKTQIENISKEFTKGIGIEIKGSGWMVVDPLSAYLNSCGFKNELSQLPETETRPLILIMTFKDGTQFVPAGSDIEIEGATHWQWIDK